MYEYRPEVGDVVFHNDEKYVVIGVYSRETQDSISFDREYYLVPLIDLFKLQGKYNEVEYSKLKNLSYTIKVVGNEFPSIEKCEDEAPFEIKKVSIVKLRRKKAKTITVWE